MQLSCPQCRGPLSEQRDAAQCQSCGLEFERRNGIWRFLLPARAAAYEPFLKGYRALRQAEGWGAGTEDYYRALPQVAATDPLRAIWNIRAKNFRRLLKWLAKYKPQRILDLGAGNGWLSYQLVRRGYQVAALDLSDARYDGLGARVFYEIAFECYQAEFDRLPFGADQFDLVVFNASLHYTASLLQTLQEVARVLRPDGAILLLETPFYSADHHGRAMLAEHTRCLWEKYSLELSPPGIGFLTMKQLEQAARKAGLNVRIWYADDNLLKRLRRAWTTRRLGRQAPSFPIVVLNKI